MYLLPLYFPLINFIIYFFFGKFFNKIDLVCSICINIMVNIFISLFIFYEVSILGSVCEVILYTWLKLDWLEINLILYYDNLTACMLVVINIISFCAHLYSLEYMETDVYYRQYMSYLSLFTFFMLILVTAENVLQLFVGWEGVGICSYLLINFWSTRLQANKSAILAIIANKVGDITLLFAIVILLVVFKSLSFPIIYYLSDINLCNSNIYTTVNYYYYLDNIYTFITNGDVALELSNDVVDGLYVNNIKDTYEYVNMNYSNYTHYFNDVYNIHIGLLLVLAAIGKSAQIGLHLWLPEAMEGPTPVSSLIHAATMVTAGIFLILRFSFLLEQTPVILCVIFTVGCFTALISTCIGVLQHDIKKVIAYSTCSQLAYMFASCGVFGYVNSFFHLYTHAFFKALLFLSAGYIIHIMNNEQDIRKINQSLNFVLFYNISFIVGSLAIMGIPFLSGFYSKENILNLILQLNNINFLSYYVNEYLYTVYCIFNMFELITILGTMYYSVKIMVNIIYKKKYNIYFIIPTHYSNQYTFVSLFILIIMSSLIGYLTFDFFLGIGQDNWQYTFPLMNYNLFINELDTNIFINNNWIILNNLEIHFNIEDFLLFLTFVYLFLFVYLYLNLFQLFWYNINIYNNELYNLFILKFYVYQLWLVDLLSINLFYNSFLIYYKKLEKGYFEYYFSYNAVNFLKKFNIAYLKTYSSTEYLLFILISTLFIINVSII